MSPLIGPHAITVDVTPLIGSHFITVDVTPEQTVRHTEMMRLELDNARGSLVPTPWVTLELP